MKKHWSNTLTVILGLAAFAAGPVAGALAGDRVVPLDPGTKVAPAHPRMTSEFHALVSHLANKSATGREEFLRSAHPERVFPLAQLRGDHLEEIETYIQLDRWDPSLLKALREAGADIVAEDAERLLLQAWIALDNIETVAAIDGVRHLRRPSYGIPALGSTTTEGDSNLNTAFIRNLGGINGRGLKIGVLSVGLFNSSFPATTAANSGSNRDQRVARGDIPRDPRSQAGLTNTFFGIVKVFPASFANHDIRTFSNVLTDEGLYGRSAPEGAAIIETIMDIAPGYVGAFEDDPVNTPNEIFFADGRTDLALEAGRQFLLGNGVKVIVDDMIFFDVGRFDGTSSVSRRAQQIALNPANDVVYITAVGNQTPPVEIAGSGLPVSSSRFPIFVNGHFSPEPGPNKPKIHNFAAGRFVGIRDEALNIRPQNGIIDVVLVWDDVWDDANPRATNDLDLYLLRAERLNLNDAFASSTDLQAGRGRPIERITSVVPNGDYAIVINRKNINDNTTPLFTLLVLQGTIMPNDAQYLTHGVPLNNADALPPVISVGAIDAVRGVNNILPESIPGTSPGPGRVLTNSFVKWYDSQQAPAVVSYSNTLALSMGSIDAAGRSNPGRFTGSSAAAAHMGGLMRLLRDAYPDIPAFQWYNILRDASPTGFLPFPNATPLIEADLAPYANAPRYLRVNGFDVWANIRDQRARGVSPAAARVSFAATAGPAAAKWSASGKVASYNEPVFGQSPQGLTLSAGGKLNTFGSWLIGPLEFTTADGTGTALDPNKWYELRARIGVDEADGTRVPHFRLRLFANRHNESAELVVASVNDASNVPTTVAGREYVLRYRPTTPEVAAQGVCFAFDILHFDPADNGNATFYIQDVTLTEIAE